MVNYWIFIAKRKDGTLEETRDVINNGVWNFISKKSEKINPENYTQFRTGDYVLFYLAAKFPDGSLIEGGRSIIGKARLGSPFIFKGEYFGEDIPMECFVFLFEPDVIFRRNIEPKEYGIGAKGRMVVEISKKNTIPLWIRD